MLVSQYSNVIIPAIIVVVIKFVLLVYQDSILIMSNVFKSAPKSIIYQMEYVLNAQNLVKSALKLKIIAQNVKKEM